MKGDFKDCMETVPQIHFGRAPTVLICEILNTVYLYEKNLKNYFIKLFIAMIVVILSQVFIYVPNHQNSTY